jgi:hypothetical protein
MQQEATERNTFFSVPPGQKIALARLAAGATVSAAADSRIRDRGAARRGAEPLREQNTYQRILS